jgi:hypothetical protein
MVMIFPPSICLKAFVKEVNHGVRYNTLAKTEVCLNLNFLKDRQKW